MFHYYATILGIRPSSMNFATVVIRPQLGPLERAKGKMAHPKGMIEVDIRRANGEVHGTVLLPSGLTGELFVNGRVYPLDKNIFRF